MDSQTFILSSVPLKGTDHTAIVPHRRTYEAKYGPTLLLLGLLAICLHYLMGKIRFFRNANDGSTSKLPPSVPHWLPYIGCLPLSYLCNPMRFVCSSKSTFQAKHPVRVTLFFQHFYILQGARNISTLFKQNSLSAFAVHGTLLRFVFSLPLSAVKTYYNDDSGEHEKPHPDSSVEPHNRVDFLTRSSFHTFLAGPGLAPLSRRYTASVNHRLGSLIEHHNNDWHRLDDFMDVFQQEVSGAVIDAMCGTFLLEHYPDFTRDLWTLDNSIMDLFIRKPKLMARGAHHARDRALGAVKSWHAWARSSFDAGSIDSDGDDPYWGSKFFRNRQKMFLDMTGFNEDAVASQELAFIWGANTNAIISAFWVVLEIFRDQQLLDDIRTEVRACTITDAHGQASFDLQQLIKQPLLQAVLSETLRLRVNGFLVRRPMRSNMKINEWIFPKGRFCLTSSTPGHMDPDIWCKGAGEDHPVTEFWPSRFLNNNSATGETQFSLKGTEGSWMPFGGGTHMCPGKMFAKHIICLSVAILATRYDCRVVAKNDCMRMSGRNFGFGTLGPVGPVPVLMRNRRIN